MSKDLLTFLQRKENLAERFVRQIKKSGKNFYCYGAGHYLQFSLEFLRRHGLAPAAVLDTVRDGTFEGIPVIRYEHFLSSCPPADSIFLITAPSHALEIRASLEQRFDPENIVCFETELYLRCFPDIDAYRQYLTKYWAEMTAFRAALEDDASRHTFDCVLKGRITGDQRYFGDCYVPDQYYPRDIISFSPGEVMVELGANDGKTLAEFLRLCPDPKRVYCFEPDPECIPLLHAIRVSKPAYCDKIVIVQKGAWSHTTKLRFFAGGNVSAGNGHIVSVGQEDTETIETAAVDDVVQEPISYMKMDIEGCELEALHGAEQQIRRNTPSLAICVYHKMTDFLDIWMFLKNMVPGYHFYLRHHNRYSGTETVLYAVMW